jgi:short-subunit dehydrogenase
VTSDSARTVVPFFSVYSASKAAVEALSDGLRMEQAKYGVSVVLFNPGSGQAGLTPLCGRQQQYHLEMAAQMRKEENGSKAGKYFEKCSR